METNGVKSALGMGSSLLLTLALNSYESRADLTPFDPIPPEDS